MWRDLDNRTALLELLERETLTQRKCQSAAWDELKGLGWARQATREDKLEIVRARRQKVANLLNLVWPTWRDDAAALAANNLPPTPNGIRMLEDLKRQATLSMPLPPRLNRRTAIAAVGPHSKAFLSKQRLGAIGNVELTCDGIARIRPHDGMQIRCDGVPFPLDVIYASLQEVHLPERALQANLEVLGPAPALILLIENLGSFIDIQAPRDWLVMHVPGWNTRTTELVLARLPAAPVLLFGDLDSAGAKIAARLQALYPALRWVTFDLWRSLLAAYLQKGDWPAGQELGHAPPLVHELARTAGWLEQERLILNAKLIVDLLAVAQVPTT